MTNVLTFWFGYLCLTHFKKVKRGDEMAKKNNIRTTGHQAQQQIAFC